MGPGGSVPHPSSRSRGDGETDSGADAREQRTGQRHRPGAGATERAWFARRGPGRLMLLAAEVVLEANVWFVAAVVVAAIAATVGGLRMQSKLISIDKAVNSVGPN